MIVWIHISWIEILSNAILTLMIELMCYHFDKLKHQCTTAHGIGKLWPLLVEHSQLYWLLPYPVAVAGICTCYSLLKAHAL